MVSFNPTVFAALVAFATADAHSSCGSSNSNYKAGVQQAKVQFGASWKYNDNDCNKIDKTYKQVKSVTPDSPYCLEQGFEDGLKIEKTKAEKRCAESCEDKGKDEANYQWQHNQDKYGDKCSDLDYVLERVNRQTPSSPKCLVKSYQAQVSYLYNKELDNCVDECVGNGEEQGDRLGDLFCSVTQLYSDSEDEPLAIQICNEQEKQACLDTLDDYTKSNCNKLRKNPANKKYYKDLEKSCSITIGPDQPNEFKMNCETKWAGRSDGPQCGNNFEPKKSCCEWSGKCGDLKKCTRSYCCKN